jgi:hypothetical protein
MKKRYIQIILDPAVPEDKKVIEYLDSRYSHIKPAQACRELIKRDMIENEKKELNK